MASLLEVSGLCKAFGDVRAVSDVCFEVRAGEIYGLLGPNGAGKTTTISMISGLLRPDAGKVTVDGADFWSDRARAQKIMGVVPQEVALYEELSGRENLEFWGRLAGLSAVVARERAGEVLEALSLADRARNAVKNYSGGMKRRINIGCALMHRPKLLLLFVLEGNLQQANPDDWPQFRERFRIIQKLDHQLVVSAQTSRHPSECLRDLLELPVRVENVTLKRPSLNDVFLQLTGRELRE